MNDGLDRLDEARRRRSSRAGSIPPSRHKPAAKPVTVVEHSESTAQTAVHDETSPPTNHLATSAPAVPPGLPIAEREQQLTKRTVHLGQLEEDFLEDVFLAGRRSPAGRVDANRSAVIRLALRQLAERMTEEQIIAEIRDGISRSGTGRPRF